MPKPTAKLSNPFVTVTRDDGTDDPKPLELQTTNADLVLWDRTRAKHRWPVFQDAPFLWLTFISWAAARRTGVIPSDLKYETWEATTLSVEAEGEDDDDVDPTHPAPGPDSS